MTSTEPCKLKYSLVHGVYVVMQGCDLGAVCESEALLWEWLDGCTPKSVPELRIFLADFDDKDEVTMLVFEAKRGDFDTYEAWAEWNGPSAFMEHWFEEGDSPEHTADFTRRYRQWNEIHVEPKREVITLIRTPADALEGVSLVAAE